MARTSFQIDSNRLRGLRERDKKTQEEVGLYVRKSCGKPSKPDTDDPRRAIVSAYHKIEHSGKTSKKTAQALANYFNVSVRALQGLEPIDTIAWILALLQFQLTEGSNEKLKAAYAKIDAELQDHSPEKKLRDLADQIGKRLEAAQWSRNSSELAELASLTGMSEAKLLTPAYVSGYWWVTDFQPGELYARVVCGANAPIYLIRTAREKFPLPRNTGGQTTIRLSRTGPRYRLEAEPYHGRRPWWFEFISCEPDGDKGVRWSAASQWDQEWLETHLRNFAFENAHVVYDFDGKRIPDDSKRLCLVVTLTSLNEDYEWQECGQRVFRGYHHEMDEVWFRKWDQEGNCESVILNGLKSDLQGSLHPQLKTYPPEYWAISTASWEMLQECWALQPEPSIEVILRQPDEITILSRDWLPAMKYEIKLMAEVSEGKFVRAPWEASSVIRLRDEIRKWVDKPLPEGGYGGDTQSFEPQAVTK